MIEVVKIEQLFAKDIIEYGAAFELRRERAVWNPLRWMLGKTKRKRINPAHLIVHKAPKD